MSEAAASQVAPLPVGALVVVATGNPGKVREMREILGTSRLTLCDLSRFAPVSFPDEGGDYRENAVEKARAAALQLGEWSLADDSGLEVEGLGGAPGAYSARFGGPGLDDAGRVRHLLAELASRADASRRARFVCWAAIASPEGEAWAAFGECPGVILEAPRGEGGFGYDPVFRPEEHPASMAELPASTKNAISHRARSLHALLAGD